MDERLLKQTAITSFILMVSVIIMSYVLSRFNQDFIYTSSSDTQADIHNWNQAGVNSLQTENNNTQAFNSELTDKLGDKYLIIKKSQKKSYDINLEDLYMDRSIKLTVVGLENKEFDNTSILRVNKGLEYLGVPDASNTGMTITETANSNTVKSNNGGNDIKQHKENPQGEEQLLIPEVISASGEVSDYGDISQTITSDPVKEFHIEYSKDKENNTYSATINIALDYIYAPLLYQDEDYIYIDLKRPKDVYDKIVVIDAGHGGKDVGTSSADHNYYEKDINLQIVLYLKELLDQEDIKVYYTRTTDKTIFLNPRVYFANDVEADLFLSVHCNSSESTIPGGFEVLYNELQKGKGFDSKQLAEIALKEMTDTTQGNSRGIVSGSEMVVVGKAKMPVALIEVAFMSNQDDMDFLVKENNQRNIAKAIYKTIFSALNY